MRVCLDETKQFMSNNLRIFVKPFSCEALEQVLVDTKQFMWSQAQNYLFTSNETSCLLELINM